MKTFCESLEKHPIEIINFQNQKSLPSTNKRSETYEKNKNLLDMQANAQR